MTLRRLLRSVPVCPICDGPCREEFERADARFPDRLNPAPKKAAKANLRGSRMTRPSEDRMHRASEDR